MRSYRSDRLIHTSPILPIMRRPRNAYPTEGGSVAQRSQPAVGSPCSDPVTSSASNCRGLSVHILHLCPTNQETRSVPLPPHPYRHLVYASREYSQMSASRIPSQFQELLARPTLVGCSIPCRIVPKANIRHS